MRIRKYTYNDKNSILRLLRLNTPKYFAPAEEADLINYLDHEIEEYFVVEENDEVIGAGGLNYFPEEATARISWDIISPAAQGKGVGSALTKHRINLLRDNSNIEVVVVRTTQLVYGFYENLGFKLEQTEKDFWANGFDLYYMAYRF